MATVHQRELRLYAGHAPGSETWDWSEEMNDNNSVKVMTVYNVVHPTLKVFSPAPAVANGTAVIVNPGGGFHFLAIDHEGNEIAKRLAEKGVTAFVLKYRLVHIDGDNPFDDMLNTTEGKSWDNESLPVIPLAVADGREAIAYVRNHAAEYSIRVDRIGIMGFSAGGMIAALTAFDYTKVNRPDFVVPVYADIPEFRLGQVLPDAPPLYLACSQDDEFNFVPHAIRMYTKWYDARRPVEMHLFTKGGHGFGAGVSSNTTHNWIDRFCEWLVMQGLMNVNQGG